MLDGCWFDLAAAERVRTFFRKFLCHSKGQWARKPFELLDWQWDQIIAPLFGWRRADDTRRFRRGYIEVPKKNGKSTLFSGLSLYLLAGDREAGAEIYSAAVDRDQASIVYNEAANMVESSPALSSRLRPVRSTRRITFHKTRSFYKALSADVPAYAGLDLSSTTDLSALVLVFPNDDGYFDVLPFFWVPEEGARRRAKRDRVPYDAWIRDEYVEATPGEAIDYDRIGERIKELGERYAIQSIAIDRWNATQLATQLQIDGFEVVRFGQGFASMNWPTKKLDEVVLAGRLWHAGHPVLRWMAGNVSIETDAADNWKPSKKKSRERIDGVVALIMALERATTHESVTGPLFFWRREDGVVI